MSLKFSEVVKLLTNYVILIVECFIIAGCYSVRPRSALHYYIPLLTNGIWRHQGKVYPITTNINFVELGQRKFSFSSFSQSAVYFLIQEEDMDEFYGGSGITWVLSSQEARAVAALKL